MISLQHCIAVWMLKLCGYGFTSSLDCSYLVECSVRITIITYRIIILFMKVHGYVYPTKQLFS